jgi:hypothetical protein
MQGILWEDPETLACVEVRFPLSSASMQGILWEDPDLELHEVLIDSAKASMQGILWEDPDSHDEGGGYLSARLQ